MTRYAYDQARDALVATWGAGIGEVAETVAGLPAAVTGEQALRLSHALSRLSQAAWRTYTHPASAAGSLDPHTEEWQREQERAAFTAVLPAIRHPNLPEDGLLVRSCIAVEEYAHRVGRVLHQIGDGTLTEQVAADVAAELAAVERAERGDLSGRARQAVHLTRADASPVQVAAADTLLCENPLGDERLFTEVDATAAAVAAAHWLHAAACVVAEYAEVDPTEVVAEADTIEALAVETPTLVLECLEAGETPQEVVTGLVAEAMLAAEGRIPDLAGLLGQVAAAERYAQEYGARAGEVRHALMPERITPLDPARPAHDLLEDLLDGLRGCWLLYREQADLDDDPDEDEETRDTRLDEAFFDAVRAEAQARHDRLI
ncbi:hypothetical protein [Carbonactinospora thermoautotrophica]|uniref:hypothetical protein n=1 Tax=Carbonactinospora thermoautotrophica TaxID=1469144 RepID=UPI002270D2AE|nr:hypothetical protein [Carbonactinospora thermoautotrophica]